MHQLRALYGERAGTFLSNAVGVEAFGVNDHATVDMLSRTIGDTTIKYGTVSTPHKTSWFDSPDHSASVSGHVATRRLVTPDEIMRMPADTLLLLRQGERPLWAQKIRYYDQREFARLFDRA
ncbi:type IV secretory system conjugative DNA transfer family protein [Sphingomonas sp. Ag1]|jgi:type IV secretion system protein VirD4|uniref:type IV secretory system conjugative DNA transfer family protein n=1 Tax=Sphingomonas sp. Ag1 TaxID=1642949 RepID=UPI000A8EF1E2|nr:type IV secretory system conjugative DNA transfer family protein [Sphingomonas sp. Ag1]